MEMTRGLAVPRRLRILFLCEGDTESWSAWSGTATSIVAQLRADGHTVETGDVTLRGLDRYVAAAATFSPRRHRWGTRYHLAGVPFRLRSKRASRRVAARRQAIDAILQVGATFQVRLPRREIPYFLICDSNIRVARQGADTGFSDAAALGASELRAIEGREAAVYRAAAAIFPLSERLRRSFVEDFGIPGDRVRAVYAGPNFDPRRAAAEPAVRGEGRPPTVLFVGLQFHRKGGEVLVESFRRLKERLPDAELLLVGVPAGYVQGPGIRCLGVLDKNQPAGAAALAAAYAAADVFALPTRFEPFGIAFVEAMHFGLPCIGPSAWAVPEIIADGETGFTVPVDDVDALTDRLLRLLSDRALAAAMGEAGRERARRLFTWPQVVARMVEVIEADVVRERGA
jgi:alpha-maltose-1-phosphate synthase